MSQFQDIETSLTPPIAAIGSESLIGLFEKNVNLTPDKTAIFHNDQSITYKDLNCEANAIAHYLFKLGIREGKIVTILLERSIDLVSSILGVLKTGAAYTVIDPDYPISRVEYILKDTNSDILLTEVTYEYEAKYQGLLAAHSSRVAYMAEYLAYADNHPKNPSIKSNGSTLACILYTSGSRGNPKGVLLNHKSFFRLFDGPNMVQTAKTDVLAQIANAAFDLSIFDMWAVLSSGASMVIIDKEFASPEALAVFFKTYKVTVALFPTALFHQLVRMDPALFQPLKTIISAGEVVSPAIIRYLLKNNPGSQRIFNLYGPMECGVFATYHEIKTLDQSATSVPIGLPVNDTEVYLLDEELQRVELGEIGEIYLAGSGVARGYLNLPGLTAEKFIPCPFDAKKTMYKTGDWAKMLPSGLIDFVGRKDNQVKVQGFRIELDEVELAFESHSDIWKSVVVAPYILEGYRKLVAYLVSKDIECKLDTEAIKSYLRTIIPEYMVPNIVIQLDAFPLNEQQKIDRLALTNKDISLIR